jgi:hypothetical protein
VALLVFAARLLRPVNVGGGARRRWRLVDHVWLSVAVSLLGKPAVAARQVLEFGLRGGVGFALRLSLKLYSACAVLIPGVIAPLCQKILATAAIYDNGIRSNVRPTFAAFVGP